MNPGYKTHRDGSINYAHYQRRGRLVRSQNAHAITRGVWRRIKALPSRLATLARTMLAHLSGARSLVTKQTTGSSDARFSAHQVAAE